MKRLGWRTSRKAGAPVLPSRPKYEKEGALTYRAVPLGLWHDAKNAPMTVTIYVDEHKLDFLIAKALSNADGCTQIAGGAFCLEAERR